MMQNVVLSKSNYAANGLERLVGKRKGDISELTEELDSISREVEEVRSAEKLETKSG